MAGQARVSQFRERLRLDLTDALARQLEALANLFERERLFVGEPEAKTQHLALAEVEPKQGLAQRRRFERPRRRETVALAGVSLRAAPAATVCVVGPSGCGKTTLLELICGLQQPDGGRVRAAPAALMPQRDLLLPWSTALDNGSSL